MVIYLRRTIRVRTERRREGTYFQKTLATIALLSCLLMTPNFDKQSLRKVSEGREKSREYVQPANEVEFHSAPIINSRPVPPRLAKVCSELRNPLLGQSRDTLVQLRRFLKEKL